MAIWGSLASFPLAERFIADVEGNQLFELFV
jgi:hypothetical protein